METVNIFEFFGVVVFLKITYFLRIKNNYRRCVTCAEHLTKTTFEIRRYPGGEVSYFLNGKRLSFLEVYFVKRDISSLNKKGIHLKKDYCNGLGKVIDEKNEVFQVCLSSYKSDILKWRRSFPFTSYERLRQLAPYSYLREATLSQQMSH